MRKIWPALMIFSIAVGLSIEVINAQGDDADDFIVYEVKSGDTLWEISKTYKRGISTIKSMNGLTGDRIAPGQSLLIPGNTYVLQPGDSLWAISSRHALSVNELATVNEIKNPLNVGGKVAIPQQEKLTIKTGAYLVPKTEASDQWLLKHYRPMVSQVGIFEVHPDINGNLSPLPAGAVVEETWLQHVEPVAVVTNLSEKGFDRQLAHSILNSPSLRNRLISNIGLYLRKHEFKGVNIDFEGIKPEDRDVLTQFMGELAKKLKPFGFTVSIAVPPKQGLLVPAYSAGYDYAALGKIVDSFFIMAYDWHWPGGPPGPIAPIQEVRKTIEYAISVVSRDKVYLGIAMYAYDWTILPDGRTSGKAYSQINALNVATENGVAVVFDETSRSPHFTYTDESGHKHIVWFEDARSIIAKFRMISDYKIRGMGGWKLGLSFPQAETMVERMFTVIKP